MPKLSFLEHLRGRKNLLAFSYGSDSTALFYLLCRENIAFDMALINYKTRLNSDLEEEEARLLAKRFHKQIFIQTAPRFKGNFEKNARDFRYAFFEKICLEKGYENVILAHQLDDKFEWFLMQLGKGAGLMELLGMNALEKRTHFTLIRPLLNVPKGQILAFLRENKLKYFDDESNKDLKFKRNFIRKHFSDEFLRHFSKGVQKSFSFLREDLKNLGEIEEFEGILICAKNASLIAKACKKLGIVMSEKQRRESLRGDCVISARVGVVYMENRAFVFHYESCEKLPKSFKERCRKLQIPKLLRAFCFNHQVELEKLSSFGLKK
ncbi:tRNA lysidine(34) synthetase TilS [Campylobacter felis]|uniref:tRNA lysidine(34) synthetase TilS n=1 Tax=Campylobacter felis TaxID=2974565 RepID=UPI00255E39A1|nr:tRNA lysidine(34) synthetase TilS [Campylobacter felis]MDL0101990.1 tRNA lysidine(34) synthetase TilS [Campylobacter felis]MDL0110601.1 tRNA lysidine(34) synthetase TilS [Campylobacter felis]